MNSVVRRLSSLFRQSGCATQPFNAQHHQLQQLQPCRGIRVQVYNGNLEGALALMQRKMTSSGIERMIKKEQRFHIKNSEKRVLARKSLERRLRSEDLARKLKSIMIRKVRLEPVIIELERQRAPVVVISHQAVLRVLYAYFADRPLKEVLHIEMPLHTIIEVQMGVTGVVEKRYKLMD